MRNPVRLGLIATAVLLAWQILTVHYNYGGNWTGLFCIRPGMPVPAFLRSENLYIFQNSPGYDGMVYHLMAHDPWMHKGSPEAIAGASFRYQRIFVPALAWMVALGQDRWVHASYFAVILGFVFLGVYWLAVLAARTGLAPAWGLTFALTPAALTSVDRMTVDVALAAFAVGFAVYCEKLDWRVIALLTCAALTRETAIFMIAGYAVYLLSRRQITAAVWAAATALPAAAWFVYLARREPPELQHYVDWVPLAGLLDRVIHPVSYQMSQWKAGMAVGLDEVALAGILLALLFCARAAWKHHWRARTAAMYALAIAVIFLSSRAVWEDAYGFGRVVAPFLLLTALEDWTAAPWITLLPMFLVDARISLNFVSQMEGVARGLAGL